MAKILFQKGNPGGPGRPKGRNYVEICRQWAEEKGWQKLIDIADGKDYKVGLKNGRVVEVGPDMDLQFQAMKTMIEYGYGKPSQAVELSTESSSELAVIPANALVEIVEALKAGKA